MNGYALSKCLKAARKAREEAEAAEEAAADSVAGVTSGAGDMSEERLKYRQYEQPGTLVTLPSGARQEFVSDM